MGGVVGEEKSECVVLTAPSSWLVAGALGDW